MTGGPATSAAGPGSPGIAAELLIGRSLDPFYTPDVLGDRFGPLPGDVAVMVTAGELLGACTGDRHLLLPAKQFTTALEPIPRLHEMVRLLRVAFDDWAVMLWVLTPIQAWDGNNAADLLRHGYAYPALWEATRDVVRCTGAAISPPCEPDGWNWNGFTAGLHRLSDSGD